MRVIGGSAKRLPLKTLEGFDTRPTTDRIKETLFNMISPYLCDCRFLDLFAGSGGIGIEALSRGARQAVFVEQNPKAMQYIRENLKFTKLDARAELLQMDVVAAIKKLDGSDPFDYIFMDPPYQKELEKIALLQLSTSRLLHEDTVIIVEAALDTDFSYLEEYGLSEIKTKKYKTNKHVFLSMESRATS